MFQLKLPMQNNAEVTRKSFDIVPRIGSGCCRNTYILCKRNIHGQNDGRAMVYYRQETTINRLAKSFFSPCFRQIT